MTDLLSLSVIVLTYLSAAQAADEATSADWLEAWATVVAAVGTVGAFWWQGRALRAERRTRRAEIQRLEDEQREAQSIEARKVVVHGQTLVQGQKRGDDYSYGPAYQAQVGNYSQLPIRDLIVRLRFLDADSNTTLSSKEARRWDVLPGGEVTTVRWDVDSDNIPDFKWPAPKDWDEAIHHFYVDVIFVDVRGEHWRLERGRNLARQPELEYPPDGVGWDGESVRRRGLRHRVRAAARALRGS